MININGQLVVRISLSLDRACLTTVHTQITHEKKLT